MNPFYRFVLLIVLCLCTVPLWAQQQVCPPNIGFESGTFGGWHLFAGSNRGGYLDTQAVAAPLDGRHTLLMNTTPQMLDPIGGFPVNSPNNSKYTLMLGNSVNGAQVDGATYTLKVPANANRFSLTYYYAVVLQNPQQNHTIYEQPAFSVNIKKTTPNTPGQTVLQSDLSCGVHTFSAQNGQAGFKDLGAGNDMIQYKTWSPVNINFIGYAGHTLQLEFMAFDCTRNGHFGYAYLDFEENCKSPITGNNYCLNQTSSITLTAPAGYESYVWTPKGNLKDTLGTGYTLPIENPVPGTEYALIVTPFVNLGCVDTLYTTINPINELFELKVQDTIQGCQSTGVNLDVDEVKAGSTPGQTYEYYLDPAGQAYIQDPKSVTKEGTYYIRGTNSLGCTDVKPITVKLFPGPELNVLEVPSVCKPEVINLMSYIRTGADVATVEVFRDVFMKDRVTDPTRIDRTGTYYIRATSAGVPCTTIKTARLVVSDRPVATEKIKAGCPPLNMFTIVNDGATENTAGVTPEFFYDAAGTRPYDGDASKVFGLGDVTYYYRFKNVYGCPSPVMAPIKLTLYRMPEFTVKDPAPVVFPQTVNLADTHVPLTYANFTYWEDAQCTVKLENHYAVSESGTYYIKAVSDRGCEIIHPVKVQVNAPPEANLDAANTFTPNGDGINDEFRPTTVGALRVNFLKIFNRYGKQVFETREVLNRWTGDINGQPSPPGTYYWVFSCYDVYRKQSFTRTGQLTLIR